LIFEKQ